MSRHPDLASFENPLRADRPDRLFPALGPPSGESRNWLHLAVCARQADPCAGNRIGKGGCNAWCHPGENQGKIQGRLQRGSDDGLAVARNPVTAGLRMSGPPFQQREDDIVQ
ncbi:MAG: hypothetical protein ACLFWF_04395 [Alphaproteobacteria bacterium]